MPSEKQIQAALAEWSKPNDKRDTFEIMRAALTAAEQAEPLANDVEVHRWQKATAVQSRKLQMVLDIPGVKERLQEITDSPDGYMLAGIEQAEPAPSARSGAVKVKALEWESIDGGNAFRAPALIFGWIRIETYTLHSWQVQWSVPGICNLLMPNVFDSPSAAKAAAQADYERRILAALEPAEQATDAEPFCWLPTTTAKWLEEYDGPAYGTTTIAYRQPLKSDGGVPLYRHLPESRLREALEEIANSDDIDNALDPERNKRLARAALAQEDGR